LNGDNIWLLWPQTDSSNELMTNMCPRTDCNNILMLNTFFTMEAFRLQDGLVMLTHINNDIFVPLGWYYIRRDLQESCGLTIWFSRDVRTLD